MLTLRFRGGPWDGIEIEAPFAPDEIRMRHLQSAWKRNAETQKISVKQALREHHVYLLRTADDEEYSSFGYEYVPDGKPHWDSQVQREE